MPKTPKILNAHTKRRAEERYGINLNKYARREIIQKIQTNEAELVSKTSNNRSLWRVEFQDESLNVVYDRKRQTMCTVLPKNAVEFQTTMGVQQTMASRVKESTQGQITNELTALWADEEK